MKCTGKTLIRLCQVKSVCFCVALVQGCVSKELFNNGHREIFKLQFISITGICIGLSSISMPAIKHWAFISTDGCNKPSNKWKLMVEYEPCHAKTGFMLMRKQRRRSAVQ